MGSARQLRDTSEIATLIRQRHDEIVRFDQQHEATVLELK